MPIENQYDPFAYNNEEEAAAGIRELSFPFLMTNSESPTLITTTKGLEPTMHMSFTQCLNASMDYNYLSRAYDMALMAGTSSDVNPFTADSSISCSSTDVSTQKPDKEKQHQEVSKPKEKEKKQREPRFAFLTKSENEHLEDGYRWRKYGQKAVKNSPYPRSYYRCTNDKCKVKKRIEKSMEDPGIVITTYEGRHNHHCPASATAGMPSSSFLPSTSSMASTSYFRQEFLPRFLPPQNNALLYQNMNAPLQRFRLPNNSGLLQDLVPSNTFIYKQNP